MGGGVEQGLMLVESVVCLYSWPGLSKHLTRDGCSPQASAFMYSQALAQLQGLISLTFLSPSATASIGHWPASSSMPWCG